MQIIVDGRLVNYQLTGKGKLVLLLHGWGDNLEGLKPISNELSKKYQVLAIDLPGFGKSQAPDEVWSLDNYGSFIKSFLNKIDNKDIYAVIGHSNGGAVAIRSLSLGLLKPKKLVLLASSGIRSGGGIRRFSLALLAKAGNIATVWMPERQRQSLRKSLYQTAGSDLMVVPELEETFKKTVRQDVQADAANISIPTLLIYGAKDDATPPKFGQIYHDLIDDSKLEIINNAGHFVFADAPEQVNDMIEVFLK